VGYFRTWFGNQRVTNNLAVTPQDFSPYCITSPANALLPGGGGHSICGFYDVSRAKVGQSNLLIDLASKYGNPSEVFNGVDVSLTARFSKGRYVQTGFSTGSTVTDTCYANDQPQLLPDAQSANASRTSAYGHGSTPWSGNTQFKVAVVYPLWWDLQASANYQNINGIPTAADAAISNVAVAPSLGRDLAACGARTGAACTSTVTANIVLANTYYSEPRLQQLDLRLSRSFRLSRGVRIQPQVDFFNVMNSNAVLGIFTRLGPSFNIPNNVLDPRMLKFGVNMTF
jgi:hypothetical protein